MATSQLHQSKFVSRQRTQSTDSPTFMVILPPKPRTQSQYRPRLSTSDAIHTASPAFSETPTFSQSRSSLNLSYALHHPMVRASNNHLTLCPRKPRSYYSAGWWATIIPVIVLLLSCIPSFQHLIPTHSRTNIHGIRSTILIHIHFRAYIYSSISRGKSIIIDYLPGTLYTVILWYVCKYLRGLVFSVGFVWFVMDTFRKETTYTSCLMTTTSIAALYTSSTPLLNLLLSLQ